jgi:hypothetical protein
MHCGSKEIRQMICARCARAQLTRISQNIGFVNLGKLIREHLSGNA